MEKMMKEAQEKNNLQTYKQSANLKANLLFH